MNDAVAVEVRRASVADLDAVAPLFDAYRVFYGLPSDPAAARAWLDERMRTGTSTVLVAHRPDADGRTGRLLGFSQLYPSFCSLELAPIVVLYDLFVTPDARGEGVATALLEAAREFGEASGAARLELSTAHTNVTAQRLYEALGWQPDEEYRHYELPLR
ncbi:GNAT family N-acetyltransferase [Herbiconiux sp. VKM Ac-1786]|uniref:GNAT family N-acetyltransferase n=1 Tax=Herbiconiux sp. VKM Ac-1786 TaxID=2783824 RepID=UPI00188B1105|nr:GNAT family N-acetyltransferase [Herbiconiux sp. VKM Ac-1786]MBF4572591.1 GNAT family N-acetyltransferase [Herbiconiux sp. VKM Ac-1786]